MTEGIPKTYGPYRSATKSTPKNSAPNYGPDNSINKYMPENNAASHEHSGPVAEEIFQNSASKFTPDCGQSCRMCDSLLGS